MRNFDNIDFHKYDKDPIPDNIKDIRAEIAKLNAMDKDKFLSPIEHQLILDRIIACRDKIDELNKKNIKITPVLQSTTIGQLKSGKTIREYSLTESKLLI